MRDRGSWTVLFLYFPRTHSRGTRIFRTKEKVELGKGQEWTGREFLHLSR